MSQEGEERERLEHQYQHAMMKLRQTKKKNAAQQMATDAAANTTFPQFLELCHNLLSKDIRVQTNPKLTTKGAITSPKGRKYPSRMRPWEGFPQQLQTFFDATYNFLCPPDNPSPAAVFPAPVALQVIGRRVHRRPISSELDLQSYERTAVEDSVIDIMEQLMIIPGAANTLLGGCQELTFENRLNMLSESGDGMGLRQKTSRIDQACVFRQVDGKRCLSLVREYTAPHKLTVEYLRAGL